MNSRAVRLSIWVLPSLFCLALYWHGLRSWFQGDDFAWLGLPLEYHHLPDLWSLLFAPKAQGTIRPWSERVFFLVFTSLFGTHPLPFRIWVFLTQFANLVLLSAITRKLTGSDLAAFAAPVLWTVNVALIVPMAWLSAYNQILCGFFLLAAFLLFLKHTETGEQHYYWLTWLYFLLGFGALETIVVFPALAATYALLCARRYFLKALPLFVPSLAFTVLHTWVAPLAKTGPYALHVDASMAGTLWDYWVWALGGSRFAVRQAAMAEPLPAWFVPVNAALLTTAFFGFLAWQTWRRRWLAVFLPAWFVILLLPVLPLRDHFSDYYLTLPAIAIGIAGAWALARGWQRGWGGAAVAGLFCLLYFYCSARAVRFGERWYFDRSRQAKLLFLGVKRAHQLHPGKSILLNGMDGDLYWAAVHDDPFRLYGAQVYLDPASVEKIQASGGQPQLAKLTLAPEAIRAGLAARKLVVYAVGGERLKNVTALYELTAGGEPATALPRRVDAADSIYQDQLGPTWYPAESGHRWMPAKATVKLGGPQSPGRQLYVSGYCPVVPGTHKPAHLSISVEGKKLGEVELSKPGSQFSFQFPLPRELDKADILNVAVEVDRTFAPPGDSRTLGLAFGTFEIK